MNKNEKATACNDGSKTKLTQELTMYKIHQKQFQINTTVTVFALPKPPSRLLNGIIDICPDCCAPLDFAGIRIVNDDSLKIVKILCGECYEGRFFK